VDYLLPGTITEMGVDVLKEIRYLQSERNLSCALRAVRGKVPQYTEVFIDEGDVDMLAAMRTYKEAATASFVRTILQKWKVIPPGVH